MVFANIFEIERKIRKAVLDLTTSPFRSCDPLNAGVMTVRLFFKTLQEDLGIDLTEEERFEVLSKYQDDKGRVEYAKLLQPIRDELLDSLPSTEKDVCRLAPVA